MKINFEKKYSEMSTAELNQLLDCDLTSEATTALKQEIDKRQKMMDSYVPDHQDKLSNIRKKDHMVKAKIKCTHCGCDIYEYASYRKDYSCNNCGQIVKDKDIIEIFHTSPILDKSDKKKAKYVELPLKKTINLPAGCVICETLETNIRLHIPMYTIPKVSGLRKAVMGSTIALNTAMGGVGGFLGGSRLANNLKQKPKKILTFKTTICESCLKQLSLDINKIENFNINEELIFSANIDTYSCRIFSNSNNFLSKLTRNGMNSKIEGKKNLEKCWFCKRNRADKGVEFNQTMNKQTNKETNLKLATWLSIDMRYPRCKKCFNIHRAQLKKLNIYTVAGTIILVLTSYILGIIFGAKPIDGWFIFLCVIFGGLLGGLLSHTISEMVINRKSCILTVSKVLGPFKNIGWQTGKESKV